ncbi:unnamed protein product [Cuscuta campestris]|uniref:Protein kinase domain-containing protein n=1 Tax=Cuscuta campestris TaxID=132261 RepID=A0A484KU47_9ASTE|nr:unnamed protein product [Cuscuta campestris]
MHWWRSAFISSATSSSPSSSAKVHADDSLIVASGGKQTLKWAFLLGRSRSRSRGRPSDGGANCHHVVCQDIDACIPSRESSCENWRARTSSSVAQPSPLPLPVPDSISISCSIPLPSPKNLHFNPKDRDVIREKADSNPSPNNDGHRDEALSLQRFLSEAARKNTGHLESLCRRKSHREPKGARRFTDLRIPPPSSAPTMAKRKANWSRDIWKCICSFQQEIKVLSNLKHPNIVQYFGSEIVGDKFYIYLEYVHPGSITKFIHDHCGAITESVVRNFTRHILCGLAYLHGTKTIHRDIKGANLLVDAYGVVKLADFGMSKHLSGQAGHLSLKGSPYWMAPELLQSDIQDSESDHALAVDIWSLGCTIIEMMNRKPPWSEYEGPAAMFKVLRESPPIPDSLSPKGKDFLQCCFRRNPAERPTASMLLEHQFVKNLHKSCLPHGIQSLDVLKLTDNLKLKREGRR